MYAVFGGLPPVLLPSLGEDQPSLDGPGLRRRFHRHLGLLRARSLLHLLLQQREFRPPSALLSLNKAQLGFFLSFFFLICDLSKLVKQKSVFSLNTALRLSHIFSGNFRGFHVMKLLSGSLVTNLFLPPWSSAVLLRR